ncbi:MAG: LolA-related protein [Steroidobacteraceae bacterium]
MISGRFSAALWCVTLLAPAAAWSNDDLDSLLATLVREPPQSIAFTEFHSSALLDRELIVSGMLDYAGPRKLSRIVVAPYAERTDIDGDDVRVLRADRPIRRFSLRRAPELGGLLTGFSALLSGDRAALEREFELALAQGTGGWQLTLEPRNARVRARIAGIRVRGAGDAPLCIVTVAQSGGRTTELLLGNAATDPDAAGQRDRHCAALP